MFRGKRISIVRGVVTTREQIRQWKASGAYDELFVSGSCEKCVVPRVTIATAELPRAVADWRDAILAAAVDADGADVRVGGKILIARAATQVPVITKNALNRILHCVVPVGFPAF